MGEIILLGVILSYAGYVVYKKTKDLKEGKGCGCGCSSCPSKSSCHKG